MMRAFLLSFLSFLSASATLVFDLPYGTCKIDDKALEEVILSESYSRLKQMHQYGITAYNYTFEPYSRFDHCLGVYMILSQNGAPYHESISGLLHDASHTAFSHFGDFLFKSHGEDAWQDLNHNSFLEKAGLAELLRSHGFKLDDIYHKNKSFRALDQSLPHLCADRIDYNLQGSYRLGLLTQEEVKTLYQDLRYDHGTWSFSNQALALKLARNCIHMMETIWSSPINHASNYVLCSIIEEAIHKKIVTLDEVCLKPDTYILQKLENSNDNFIIKGLNLIKSLPELVINGTQFQVPYKCRAIDPAIRVGSEQVKPLSELSKEYKKEFMKAYKKSKKGFSFSFKGNTLEENKPYFKYLLESSSI